MPTAYCQPAEPVPIHHSILPLLLVCRLPDRPLAGHLKVWDSCNVCHISRKDLLLVTEKLLLQAVYGLLCAGACFHWDAHIGALLRRNLTAEEQPPPAIGGKATYVPHCMACDWEEPT